MRAVAGLVRRGDLTARIDLVDDSLRRVRRPCEATADADLVDRLRHARDAATVFVSGSIRSTPSTSDVVQRLPSPKASHTGSRTRMRARTLPLVGSTLTTSFSSWLATQSDPAPYAIPTRPKRCVPWTMRYLATTGLSWWTRRSYATRPEGVVNHMLSPRDSARSAPSGGKNWRRKRPVAGSISVPGLLKLAIQKCPSPVSAHGKSKYRPGHSLITRCFCMSRSTTPGFSDAYETPPPVGEQTRRDDGRTGDDDAAERDQLPAEASPHGSAPRPRGSRRVEGRVVVEDRLLERLQAPARFEAEVASKSHRAAAVDLERVGLPACAVEGEHQLLEEVLTVRVLLDEPLELRDEPAMRSELELCVDSRLERGQDELVEMGRLALGPRLAPKILQRLSADRPERIAQALERLAGAASAAARTAASSWSASTSPGSTRNA